MDKTLRLSMCVLAAVIAIAVLGCGGASSAQVQEARAAKYDAPPEVVFNAVLEAVSSLHKIAGHDPSQGIIETESKWYTPSGTSAPRGASGGAYVEDGSVLLGFAVGVRGEPGAWHVEVLPLASQVVAGSPQGRQLRPGDPSMPGWVQGKVDNIFVAVHAKLKEYAVGATPAPAPAP
jgi:hypothetical protein